MFAEIQIAPSLLSADFMNLERDLRMIEQGGPEWLHVDVMDGHFVPNLTIGPPVIKMLKQITNIRLDVHLMIDNPAEQLDGFLAAGADLITVHLEAGTAARQRAAAGAIPSGTAVVSAAGAGVAAAPAAGAAGGGVGAAAVSGAGAAGATGAGSSYSIAEVAEPDALVALIERIHAAGTLAGIALNPGTPASAAAPFIGLADLVMVMSVHPGFGGQGFIQDTLEKLAALVVLANKSKASPLLEVDGGINAQTAVLVAAQGADLLVAGNAIFCAENPLEAMAAIRQAADSGRAEAAARICADYAVSPEKAGEPHGVQS